MKKIPVEHAVASGFGIALTILVLTGSYAYYSTKQSLDAERWVGYAHQVISQIEDVLAQIYRAESAQRGFVIAGTELYLGERNRALENLDTSVAQLERLVADNPSQQQHIPELRALFAERRAIFDRFVELRKSEGLEAASRQFGAGPGVMSKIRDVLINRMRREERALLEQRKAEEETRLGRAEFSFSVLMAVVVIALVSLFWKIRRDLNERGHIEQARLQSERRLQAVLENMGALVSLKDMDGRYILVNRHYAEFINRPADEILGKTDEDFFAKADTGTVRAHYAKVLETQRSLQFEERIDMPGGRYTFYASRFALYDTHGKPYALGGVLQDITEKKRLEEELSQAAHYEQTQNQALTLFNSTYDAQRLTQDLLALLARSHPFPVSAFYAYDEWSGVLHRAAAWGPPHDLPLQFKRGEGLVGQALSADHAVVLEGIEPASLLRIETGVATFYPSAVLLCPVQYQERRIGVLALAANRALSERDRQFADRLCVQMGVALNNAKQYGDLKVLADQLRQRGEEIEYKNRQLEEANRMKTEFLANMSHELRTPLNSIIGFSETLKDGLAGELTAQQREFTNDIFTSGLHLLALINDILDLSKVEAGKMELDLEDVDIPHLLHSSVAVLKENASLRKILLTVDIQAGVARVRADARRLKQIVYNLLSNAVKFTLEGGSVTLQARRLTAAQAADLTGAQAAEKEYTDYLELSVTDTGIGITEEDLDKLFQPFMQLDSSLARKYDGTGLGLVMVRRLAELHGGGVRVESQLGKGSCFRVWFPYREASGADAAAHVPALIAEDRQENPRAPVAPSNGQPLVLVIEDDDKAADLMRLHLESEGLAVLRSRTAEQGLELACQHRPHLITLDIYLPGMDGWEFLERMKAQPLLASIPVVILSITQDRQKGFSLGAAQVLQKPVRRDELMAALADLELVPEEKKFLTLVVDDDPKAVKLLASYLQEAHCAVACAYGGADGIAAARRLGPDLIVLDLMMPEVSGFDVVDALSRDAATAMIPILVVTAKFLTAQDRSLLTGQVRKILEKSAFNRAYFVSEVRRALALGKTKKNRKRARQAVVARPLLRPLTEEVPAAAQAPWQTGPNPALPGSTGPDRG